MNYNQSLDPFEIAFEDVAKNVTTVAQIEKMREKFILRAEHDIQTEKTAEIIAVATALAKSSYVVSESGEMHVNAALFIRLVGAVLRHKGDKDG